MSAGMQVWDAQGNIIFDTTYVVGRVIGVIDASATSGSATVIGLDQGTPFAIPQLTQSTIYTTINTFSYPVCSFNGNVVSWTRYVYPSGVTLPSCNLILGVR